MAAAEGAAAAAVGEGTGDTGQGAAGPSAAAALGASDGAASAEVAAGAPEPSTPDFARDYTPDQQAFVNTKGWKTSHDVLTSYQNLEKLHGKPADQLVALPADWSNEAAVAEFEARVGVPASASDYEVEGIALSNGAEFDMGEFSERAHRMRLSQRQVGLFREEMRDFFDSALKDQAESARVRDAAEEVDLKKDWGKDYDARLEVAKQAQKAFPDILSAGDLETMQRAIGYGKVMRMFQAWGNEISESRRGDDQDGGGDGRAPTFGMTPQAARAEIEKLIHDKDFFAKRTSRDKLVADAANDHIRKLQKIAASDPQI